MAMARLESVTKEFDDERSGTIDDLTLEIGGREALTLVGPPGCGTSTALRILAGLETPTSGSVEVGGEDVTNVHAHERDVATVLFDERFWTEALYRHKTVRQNMAFGLRMSAGVSTARAEARVRETATAMGLADLLDETTRDLSTGQQRRIALGRAIAREPDVLLLDDPLSNLDATSRATMRTEFTRLQNELGTAIVYATSDQTEAMSIGDRVAVLDDGVLQQIGTPNHVYESPATEFVGTFIGSPTMNVLDVGVSVEGKRVRLTADNGSAWTLVGDRARRIADADVSRARLGVRPKNVAISREPDGEAVTAVVDVVEYTGSDTLLHLDLGEGFVARADSAAEPTRGDTVGVRFDASAAHVFDADGASLLYEGEPRLAAA